MSDTTTAAALASLLTPGNAIPIEQGAVFLFEAMAGAPIRAEVRCTGKYELTDDERETLLVRGRETACLHQGLLSTGAGAPIAEITAVLLPRRVPGPARQALGITPTGTARDGRLLITLDSALRGLGVWRHQLEVDSIPRGTGADGALMALSLRALLGRAALPIALVTERVYRVFVEAATAWPGGVLAMPQQRPPS